MNIMYLNVAHWTFKNTARKKAGLFLSSFYFILLMQGAFGMMMKFFQANLSCMYFLYEFMAFKYECIYKCLRSLCHPIYLFHIYGGAV